MSIQPTDNSAEPQAAPALPAGEGDRQRLDELLNRIHKLTSEGDGAEGIELPVTPRKAPTTPVSTPVEDAWYPPEVSSFREGGLSGALTR